MAEAIPEGAESGQPSKSWGSKSFTKGDFGRLSQCPPHSGYNSGPGTRQLFIAENIDSFTHSFKTQGRWGKARWPGGLSRWSP